MTKRVYGSPSPQEYNIGWGKYHSEMFRMRRVWRKWVAPRLRAAGVEVKMSRAWWAFLPSPQPMYRAVAASNAWGADLHLPTHSNAGPSSADGTIVFYAAKSKEGKRAAEIFKRHLDPISPGSDYPLATTAFYESTATVAPAPYLELMFHTNPKEAQHLIDHERAYGHAIADAALEFLGVLKPQPKPEPKPVPVPVPKPRPRIPWWRRLAKKGH